MNFFSIFAGIILALFFSELWLDSSDRPPYLAFNKVDMESKLLQKYKVLSTIESTQEGAFEIIGLHDLYGSFKGVTYQP